MMHILMQEWSIGSVGVLIKLLYILFGVRCARTEGVLLYNIVSL